MKPFSRLNDSELDQLLTGRLTADGGELDDLAAFLRELTHTFRAVPDAATEARHVHAIMDAVRTAAPVEAAQARETAARATPAWRRRQRTARRPLARRVALAAVLSLGLFCGVAYAGALPRPVQGAVADVARNVGVSLPGAHNDKDDGSKNNGQNGQPSTGPADTQTDTNGAAGTSGAENGQGHGNQHEGEQGNQNRTGSQDHGNSTTQNQSNGSGTNGNRGSDGSGDSGGSQGAGNSSGNANQSGS